MATRRELTAGVGQRYREASRAEKARILDEFVGCDGLPSKARDAPAPRRYRAILGSAHPVAGFAGDERVDDRP